MMQMRENENIEKLKDYADVVNKYVSNNISVLDFEQKYLEMFKTDQTLWIGEEFEVLNDLFGDIDAFCYDSTIRSSEDLDETQLRSRAKIALERLKKLLR